jgi:hypothetical protein
VRLLRNLNDPARGEPVHRIFMAKVLDDTNQGPLHKGILVLFPSSETLVSL